MANTTSGTFGTHVVMDPKGLAEVLRGPNGPVVRQLLKDGELVKDKAKQECPVHVPEAVLTFNTRSDRRVGQLRDSIVKRVVTGADGAPVVMVGSEDPVALWVHEGTVPHTIRARNAPRLVFYWRRGPDGPGIYRFKQVSHPGTQPNRFLLRALAVLRGRY